MAESRLEQLLVLHDSPRRSAAAFAVGVFLSFSPFLGFQIGLAAFVALVWRLNKFAVFVGLNANLPWFVVPWYSGTTWVAARWLGEPPAAPNWGSIVERGWWSWDGWRAGATALQPWLLPFLVGGVLGALVLSVAAYVVARVVLERRALAEAGAP